MWAGTRRLLQRGVARAGQASLRGLSNDDRLILSTSPYPSVADLVDDCVVATLDDVDGPGRGAGVEPRGLRRPPSSA